MLFLSCKYIFTNPFHVSWNESQRGWTWVGFASAQMLQQEEDAVRSQAKPAVSQAMWGRKRGENCLEISGSRGFLKALSGYKGKEQQCSHSGLQRSCRKGDGLDVFPPVSLSLGLLECREEVRGSGAVWPSSVHLLSCSSPGHSCWQHIVFPM